MDQWTQERYGSLSDDDLKEERWPWRNKPATNTPTEIAARRRQLWLSFRDLPMSHLAPGLEP